MTVLVLASASSGRRSTLRRAGVDPVVRVSDVDEDAVVSRYQVSDPEDIALVLARAKAEQVATRVPGDSDLPDGALVLGCDSVLDLDGIAHGKPADAEDARRRWRAMRGRSGVLHTGHWLVDAREDGTGGTLGAVSSTIVHFADLSDGEIDDYVATGEPLAVAGAFTVDGLGGAFVSRIEGDYHGVVGVSLPLLRELTAEVGVRWTSLWTGIRD
ncbi:MAG TPA: nucleoside triphosphate pyrophosphatase [Kineosporiaceae bacterium]|nr:nucleoside triphosphate pyrophosphatase [Kineosporiaceae bacterium]